MSKERFLLRWFIFCGYANCVAALYHAWFFNDKFFAFNCSKKTWLWSAFEENSFQSM